MELDNEMLKQESILLSKFEEHVHPEGQYYTILLKHQTDSTYLLNFFIHFRLLKHLAKVGAEYIITNDSTTIKFEKENIEQVVRGDHHLYYCILKAVQKWFEVYPEKLMKDK